MVWRAAFSTLGCSRLPLADVVDLARQGGWDGLEFRAAPGEPVHMGLTMSERADVRSVLAEAGLTPLAIASYVDIDDPGITDSAALADVLAHVELAHDLGASFVRVFPGGPSDDGAAIRRLTAVGRQLDDYPGVAIGFETHDSYARGRDVARLLARAGHPRIRAIWDLQHPWLAGEPIGETVQALAQYLGYVQITDVRSTSDSTPCLLGTGVLPLGEARSALQRAGYGGWISFEWASYWFSAAPPLADALTGARRWISGAPLEGLPSPGTAASAL
jgi:sugar phosphate isomerase/epimerase